MIALVENLLKSFLTHFTYLALILVLAVAGMGVPIPEDIPLFFSGYLCSEQYSPVAELHRLAEAEPDLIDADKDGIPEHPNPARHKRTPKVPNLYLMIASGMFGVLLGDSIVFSIGRRGIDSDNFVARHLRKVLHSKRREKVERHFARHGNLTVFAGRFMPGFRSIVFAFAGMSKMSYTRFLLIDGMAAAISVPVFVVLGYVFAPQFDSFVKYVRKLQHIVMPVVVVLVIGGVVLYIVRRRRRRALAALENA